MCTSLSPLLLAVGLRLLLLHQFQCKAVDAESLRIAVRYISQLQNISSNESKTAEINTLRVH